MKNADMPAMPLNEPEIWVDPQNPNKGTLNAYGLTKREIFAMHAMQGMLASNFVDDFGREINDESYDMPNGLTNNAVRYADALLAQLEEGES